MQVQHGDFFAFYFLSVVASLLCGHNSAGRKKVNFLQISCDPQEEPSAPQNFLKHPAGEFPISHRKVKTHLRTPICVRIGLEWLWHSSPDCRSPPRGCHRWGNNQSSWYPGRQGTLENFSILKQWIFFAITGWYIIIRYLIMFDSSQSCCDLAPPVSISLQYQSVNHFAGEVKHTAVVLINSRWRNYISFSGDWILDDKTSVTSWWSSFSSTFNNCCWVRHGGLDVIWIYFSSNKKYFFILYPLKIRKNKNF